MIEKDLHQQQPDKSAKANTVDGNKNDKFIFKRLIYGRYRWIFAIIAVLLLSAIIGLVVGLTPKPFRQPQVGTPPFTTRPTTIFVKSTTSAYSSSSKGSFPAISSTTTPNIIKPTNSRNTIQPTTNQDAATNPAITNPIPTSKYSAVNNPRLPRLIVPNQYWFQLDVNIAHLNFSGYNTIELSVTYPTKLIIVHAKLLTMTSIPQVTNTRISTSNTKHYHVQEHGYYFPNQYYYVALKDYLAIGTYYIKYQFQAPLNRQFRGLYAYSYISSPNQRQIWAVASQTQPNYARMIIPCFDEPSFPAIFHPSVIISMDYSALSNTEILDIQPYGLDKIRVRFDPTRRMASYFLTIVIHNFRQIQQRTKAGSSIRIWARKSVSIEGQYALAAAINITNYFESILNISSPSNKQDHVALPTIAVEAASNWGILIYREDFLLNNISYVSVQHQQRITVTVAYQIAQMWFGSLMPIRKWDDLWLSESLSCFYEIVGAAYFQPSFQLMGQFIVDHVQLAQRNEGVSNSFPLASAAEHSLKSSKPIYCHKGAAVFRMLQNYIGDSDYLSGITDYLKHNAYKFVSQAALFNAFTKATKNQENIANFMNPWITQRGYPIVTIQRDPQNADGAILVQRPFVSTVWTKSSDQWNIPFTWYYGSSPNNIYQTIVNVSSVATKISWPRSTWIKANVNQYGYYRVNYPLSNWHTITSVLQSNPHQLTKLDISSLLDDAFELARGGNLSYSIPLNITKYLNQEITYLPWQTANTHMMIIRQRILLRPTYDAFKKYYLKILQPVITIVGYQDIGHHNYKLLRFLLLDSACLLGDQSCVNYALTTFRNFMNDPSNAVIPANKRSIVFRYGIRYGGNAEWNFLYSQFKRASNINDKIRMAHSLSLSTEATNLQRYLNDSITENQIDPTYTLTILNYVAQYGKGRQIAWDFVQSHTNYFTNRYGTVRLAVEIVSKYFNTQTQFYQVEQFLKANPDKTNNEYSFPKKQTILLRIKQNIDWLQHHEATLQKWFTDNSN